MMGRTLSSDLLNASDEAMMAHWRKMDASARVPAVRGWFHQLYSDTFAGKRIVEVGSGFGFDGINFLRQGAHWTFSDLVADNLALVKRIVDNLGLGARASYVHVDGERAFADLAGGPFDAVWAIGSLHHAPFDIARAESLDLLRHLKKGGRWIELTYPYERWLREGARPFTEFGKSTDGERTPWAEWYDLAKVKRRLFPTRTTTLLDFTWGGGNFGWIDLRVEDTGSATQELSREIELVGRPARVLNGSLRARSDGLHIACPKTIWWPGSAIELDAAVRDLGAPPLEGLGYAVDLEIEVEKGSVGVVLTAEDIYNSFLGREQVVDAGPAMRRVTIETADATSPRRLLVRNAVEGLASRAHIRSALLRFAA